MARGRRRRPAAAGHTTAGPSAPARFDQRLQMLELRDRRHIRQPEDPAALCPLPFRHFVDDRRGHDRAAAVGGGGFGSALQVGGEFCLARAVEHAGTDFPGDEDPAHQPVGRLAGGEELADLARQTGTTARTLSRRLTLATGLSPMRFAQKIRLDAALHLLQTTRLPLEAVAEKVGLEDCSALYRLIRRHTGKSPGLFRAPASPSATPAVAKRAALVRDRTSRRKSPRAIA